MKRFVQQIHEGENLEENLKKYEKKARELYCDYASLELTFSAFTFMQELVEEKADLAQKEKDKVDLVKKTLARLGRKTGDADRMISDIKEIRQKITDKMDYLTALTDKLICYEYVLNRMEYCFMPEKELEKKLAVFEEEEYMNALRVYLFGQKEESIVRDKIRLVMGELPVRMTKAKFYEKIEEALTLYKDGDKSSLDSFLYQIRTASMLYEPKNCHNEYPDLQQFVGELECADYSDMTESQFHHLVDILEEGAKKIALLTDFYYSMQRVVNAMYAMLLVQKYAKEDTKLVLACRSIWICLAQEQYRDEMLIPLEGRIEKMVEQTSYLEAVLFEAKVSYKNEIAAVGLTEFFEDFANIANLLSDSLFVDLDCVKEEEPIDDTYIEACREQLFFEMEQKLTEVSRPVKRAIMGKVLEKLPLVFQKSGEVEEYIRMNLFACQNKAEKCTVMNILWNIMQEEKEWSSL